MARQLDLDRVTALDLAPEQNDAHHAGLPHETTAPIAPEHGRQEARLEPVQLRARIAQTGDLDHCFVAKLQSGTDREAEQIDPARGDILAHVARRYDEPSSRKLVVQLRMNEVDLAKVRLSWIPRYPGAMLDSRSVVGVRFHAEPGEQDNPVLRHLAEAVRRASADGGNAR
jgi:hypothetical protein